ncbi:MAG: hypothetical protein M3Q07_00220, partial [Pseudobdellovibrionaceae bacterium]|nr:hypothetical protein [Pseudobdellovibrionaceae bacterium]
LALTPVADAQNQQNLVYAADGKPVRVVIDDAARIKVSNAQCADGVCTIDYVQTEKIVAAPAVIVYHLTDDQGRNWAQGRLTVKAQEPQIPADFTFTPRFGDTVKISVPIKNRDGSGLTTAPDIMSVSAQGGEVVQSSCTTAACEFDYLYKSSSLNPLITFQFSTPEAIGAQVQLKPAAEVIQHLPSKKSAYESMTSIALMHGVDYTSSWMRPATYVQTVSVSGLSHPSFSCSATGCLANYVKFSPTQPMWLTYKIGQNTTVGRVDWNLITPLITPTAKEVVLNSDTYTDVTFAAGTDYTSEGGVPASSIDIETGSGIAGLSLGTRSCSAAGTCKVQIMYSGAHPFVLLNYSLLAGTYRSPKQTLKVMAQVSNTDSILQVWDDKKETYTVEIHPGRDYQTIDASKATSIDVASSNWQLKFPEAEALDDTNRSKIFTCDEQGVCRGLISKAYTHVTETTLRFKVVTPTVKGGVIEKKLQFLRDKFKFKDPNPFTMSFGEESNATVDKFSVRLEHGKDYDSAFPAQEVSASVIGAASVTFAAGNKVPCDETGSCLVEGSFTSPEGYVDIAVVLKNPFGEGQARTVRLIREKFAPFQPNLVAYALQDNGSSRFEVVIERGDAKGYHADEPASTMRVYAIAGFFADAPAATTLDVPCDQGRCRFQIKAVSYQDTFRYQLIDAAGKVSITTPVSVRYPEPLAIDTRVSIPADFAEFEFEIPANSRSSSSQEIIIEVPEGVTANAISLFNVFKVKIKLPKALTAGQELKLPYKVKLGEKTSHQAEIILRAAPSLSLKKNLVVKAVRDAGSEDNYTLKLNYAEHFNALPSGGPDLAYYFYPSKHFALRLENAQLLQVKAVSCDMSEFECEYHFARTGREPLAPVTAELLGGMDSLTKTAVIPGSLTIQFN